MDAWSALTGLPRGEVLTLDHTWELAKLWYQDRMDPGFRGRSADEAQHIFRQLGLHAPLWDVQAAE